jgi:hypothetical protein
MPAKSSLQHLEGTEMLLRIELSMPEQEASHLRSMQNMRQFWSSHPVLMVLSSLVIFSRESRVIFWRVSLEA